MRSTSAVLLVLMLACFLSGYFEERLTRALTRRWRWPGAVFLVLLVQLVCIAMTVAAAVVVLELPSILGG